MPQKTADQGCGFLICLCAPLETGSELTEVSGIFGLVAVFWAPLETGSELTEAFGKFWLHKGAPTAQWSTRLTSGPA